MSNVVKVTLLWVSPYEFYKTRRQSRGEISNLFICLFLEELKILVNHKEDNDARRQWREGRRSMSTGNMRATRLHESMFLPLLEYPFFSGRFCCRAEGANKSARTVTSQFHGLHQRMQLRILQKLEGVSLKLRWNKGETRMNTERHWQSPGAV